MIPKLAAGHDAFYQAGHSAFVLHAFRQVFDERQIADRFAAAQRVSQQLAGQRAMETRLLAGKVPVQTLVADDLLSVAERAGSLDRFLITILIPPAAEWIEILQRETERVEP